MFMYVFLTLNMFNCFLVQIKMRKYIPLSYQKLVGLYRLEGGNCEPDSVQSLQNLSTGTSYSHQVPHYILFDYFVQKQIFVGYADLFVGWPQLVPVCV